MRNITINLPEAYLKLLEKIGQKTNKSRSELVRIAIKKRLEKDLSLFSLIMETFPEIEIERKKREIELQKEKISKFFNFCINCGTKLHTGNQKNHYKYMNMDIFELKFCCICFKKFEGKSLDELPALLLKKIQQKLKEYKNQTKKS